MGRAWMERWIGRDRARFVDATRARTIETTDRTTQKKSPVTSSRRWTRRGRDDDGVIRSSDDVDAGTVGDGGVAAIAARWTASRLDQFDAQLLVRLLRGLAIVLAMDSCRRAVHLVLS